MTASRPSRCSFLWVASPLPRLRFIEPFPDVPRCAMDDGTINGDALASVALAALTDLALR